MKKRERFKIKAINPIGKLEIFFVNAFHKYKIERLKQSEHLYVPFQGSFYLTESIKIELIKPVKVDYKNIPIPFRPKIRKKERIFKSNIGRVPTQKVVDGWKKELSLLFPDVV